MPRRGARADERQHSATVADSSRCDHIEKSSIVVCTEQGVKGRKEFVGQLSTAACAP